MIFLSIYLPNRVIGNYIILIFKTDRLTIIITELSSLKGALTDAIAYSNNEIND